VTWSGARVFDGRSIQPGLILSGAALWLLAHHLPGFSGSGEFRTLLSAAIIAGYSWASAYELWRGRTEGLLSRWPAILLLFAHGPLFLLRSPLAAVVPSMGDQSPLATAWLTVLSPEALLFTIATAFVLLAMGKERTELGHKKLALIDPLTGLANRRGFIAEADRITRNQVALGRPVAVFIIDLDHFKSINDRFGHAVGDRVLSVFGQTCAGSLRGTDLSGRIGGEEFAVLIADATRDNAFLVAERIRAAFENAGKLIDGEAIFATASIGVAIVQGPTDDISKLMKHADEALYRAKQLGRNRVELAPLAGEETLEPVAEPTVRVARARA
jgi:diguanylate cyclase (GGDEF)-like protein